MKYLIQWVGLFYNCSLKIWESIGIQIPKMGAHLGVWGFIPSHSPTLLGAWNVTPRLHSWPTLSQALVLVANPRLGLWQGDYWFIFFIIGESNMTTLFFRQNCLTNLGDLFLCWRVKGQNYYLFLGLLMKIWLLDGFGVLSLACDLLPSPYFVLGNVNGNFVYLGSSKDLFNVHILIRCFTLI
jgi:hypothetical protein